MGRTNILFVKILLINIVLFFTGCGRIGLVEEARLKSVQLMEQIGEGSALEEFSVKYFPEEQRALLLNDLKYNCDFKNREGNFVNDFTSVENGTHMASFIYEYKLKCDTARFIPTYILNKNIELYRFKIEDIGKNNPMITKPHKQLKL